MSTNLTTASLEELNVSVTDRKQETEPILIENKDRFVLFPIKHGDVSIQSINLLYYVFMLLFIL